MNSAQAPQLDPKVEAYIDAFEESMLSLDPSDRYVSDAGTDVDVRDFLPSRDDPLFLRVATELIRVDLELAWQAGKQKSLSDYQDLLSELETDDELRSEAAFEEYRQRSFHGEEVSAEAVSSKYHVSPETWTTIVEPTEQRTKRTGSADEILHDVPQPGEHWREFEIVEEIGRGAMSRVLLAKQTSLSERKVVLKFAPKHMLEAEKLAKLQHQNIVPVFSVYETQRWHVFCMPYLGNQTLAQLTPGVFGEIATLELLHSLASAIAHAEQRGILHNDIKPANVLWTEEQPMLLDFNLAVETSDAKSEQIGGTLPYMAPEALEALANNQPNVDPRSDLFSLGALATQLVSGQTPFGETKDLADAIESRRKNAEPLDTRNYRGNDISPGFRSILMKCLESDPNRRYQNAEQLQTDVRRHLDNLPLRHAANTSVMERVRKWCRRHPRISSLTSVLSVFALCLMLGALAWNERGRRLQQLQAQNQLVAFHGNVDRVLPSLLAIDLDVVNREETLETALVLASTYGKSADKYRDTPRYQFLNDVERQSVDKKIAKLALLTSGALTSQPTTSDSPSPNRIAIARYLIELAEEATGEPTKSQLMFLSKTYRAEGNPTEADSLLGKANAMLSKTPDDLQMVGWVKRLEQDPKTALRAFRDAVSGEPDDYTKWYNLSQAHGDLLQWDEAEHCLTTCIAIHKDSALPRYRRGLTRQELELHELAIEDFSTFLELSNESESGTHHPSALLNRAISYKAIGQHKLALADADKAIELGFNSTRPLLVRSRIREKLGDRVGARKDKQAALAATPKDDIGWVSRGVAKMNQPENALQDFQKALELNPRCRSALLNSAYLLSEKLDEVEQGIQCLDQLTANYPLDVSAFGGRGVLLARQGRFDQAIDDAQEIVRLKGNAVAMLQGACIYARASKKDSKYAKTAITLLGQAFKLDPGLGRLAKDDPDMKEIHDIEMFKELCKAAQLLAGLPDASSIVGENEQSE